MNRTHIGAALACLLLAAWAAPAAADGVFFPPVGYPDLPAIPAQRAILAWRDGNETLVIESTVRTPSMDIGWIVPLPAEPNGIAAADTGVLTSMAMCQRPVIYNYLASWWEWACLILVLSLPFAAMCIWSGPSTRLRKILLPLLIDVLLLFFLSLFASLGRTAGVGGGSMDVCVCGVYRAGRYDASVLRAASGGDLNLWLADSGLRGLDAPGLKVVDDYIARGWCFVVSRLRKDANEATSHPLQMDFRSPRPVYPMKLTGLAGTPTRVELYVIAPQQALAHGFTCAAADTYIRRRYPETDWPYEMGRGIKGDAFASSSEGLVVGSPDILGLMWDGCVVTALEGTFEPGQMNSDFELAMTPLQPHRNVRFSDRGRRDVALAILAWGAIGLMVGAAAVFRGRHYRKRGARRLGIAAAILLAAAGCTYLALPKIAIHEAKGARWTRDAISRDLAFMCSSHKSSLPTKSSELQRLVEGWTNEKNRMNVYTGRPLEFERSPGNFTIRRVDGRLSLCGYDENGVELRYWTDPTSPTSQPDN